MIPALFNVPDKQESITLCDTSGLLYRALFSQQAASISTFCGDPAAGPTVMFFGMVAKLVKDFSNPIFVLDGWPKRKVELYANYKASRAVEREKDPQNEFKKGMRSTLRNTLIQYLPTVVGIHPHEEADDSIASLAAQLKSKGVRVNIISSDKDLWQLIEDGVRLFSTSENGYYEVTSEKAYATFGCPKEKIALYKTWLGDAGDDVPKIYRLPTKIALTLINGSDNFEDSIVKIPYLLNDPKISKWKNALLEFIPQARINWELVNAKKDLEVGFAYFRSDPNVLQSLLNTYQVSGFTSEELFRDLIPHQEAVLRILAKHGMLTKIWQYEEVFKQETVKNNG